MKFDYCKQNQSVGAIFEIIVSADADADAVN